MPEPSSADPRQTADHVQQPSTDLGTTGADFGLETRAGPGAALPNIPGYELLDELGKGGMGIVYRGRQIAADRVVALKIILGGGALDEHALARFRTEAQAVARLQHPNIVQVFEVGEWRAADGGPVPFFSLEFCPGGSLATKLAGTPLPPAEAAALVEALARAMQAAHDKGVIHRDLKPANVLLGEDGTAKVSDFGLAKKLDDEAGETASGAVMGTPSYMAPEQARGEVVGPLADVYALGAILYECLTGRPPFKSATKFETIQQVIADDPVPPRAIQPGVPADLETVCLKCLHKEPARRYDRAAELADDLGRYRAGEPIVARPVGWMERAAKWARRRPTAASLIGVLGLGTLLLVGGWAGFTYRLDQARRDALTQKGIAEDERGRAEEALRESRIVSANLALERGQTFGDRGNAATALHWFVRGLELAPVDEHPLRTALLANLAAWRGHVHSLHSRMGHPKPTVATAISPDGRVVTTASGAQAITWDAETGQRLGEALDHPDVVYDVAFSPDGTTMLTGCRDGHARLWSLKTRSAVGRPFVHMNSVTAVVFRPDGKAIATGSVGREVRLWNLFTGSPIGDPLLHDSEVSRLGFRPDGQVLLTASNDGMIHLWDAKTGKLMSAPLQHGSPIQALAWFPDGDRVLVSDRNFNSCLLDVAGWKIVGTPLRHNQTVQTVAVGPGGQVAICEGGEVHLWDADLRRQVGPSIQHQGSCLGVAFASGGKRLLTLCNDSIARLYDLAYTRPAEVAPKFDARFNQGSSAAIRPDGKAVAFGTFRKQVQIVEVATGQLLGPVRPTDGPVVSSSYSPDGTKLLVGSLNVACLFNVDSWEPAGPPLPHHGYVRAVGFGGEGRLLLTATLSGAHTWDADTQSRGSTAHAWDAASGKPIGQVPSRFTLLGAIAGSPDGQSVLAAGGEHVWLWDMISGRMLHELKPGGFEHVVTFSRDGMRMATGGSDKVARIWDVATGRPITSPLLHAKEVRALQFSPDGRLLLTGSTDTSARLWDVATGKRIGPLLQHSDAVLNVAFGSGGHTIVAVAAGGRIGTWKVQTPLTDEPRRWSLWAQVLTAQELGQDGGVHALSDSEWRQRREQLAALGGPPPPRGSAP